MSTREHFANNAIRRAVEFRERMVERLEEEMAARIGTQEVTVRRARKDIRGAMGGDAEAMARVMTLALENGHSDGEGGPCRLCEEIDVVLRE